MTIKLRTFVFILVLVAVVIFAALNWSVFTQPSPLNILVGTVMAPLGTVMLTILAGVTLLYLLFLAKAETEGLVGSRKANRELDEARTLALDAERSRLTALRDEIQQGLGSVDDKLDEILRRVDAQGRVAVRRETTVAPEAVVRSDEDIV